MKTQLVNAAVILLATTCYSVAADPGLPMEEPPVGFNWTGGYIGAQVGYALGNGHAEDAIGTHVDPDPDGFIGGIYVGYNYQFSNNVVIGGELDATYSDVDGTGNLFNLGVPSANEFSQKLKWSGAARMRLGYAAERWLPYIAGGVAFGEFNGWNVGLPDDQFSDTYTGWTIGAGAEYAFTDNLIGRAEYRYTDFGSESFQDGMIDMDLSTHDIRLGIAYKF